MTILMDDNTNGWQLLMGLTILMGDNNILDEFNINNSIF